MSGQGGMETCPLVVWRDTKLPQMASSALFEEENSMALTPEQIEAEDEVVEVGPADARRVLLGFSGRFA